MLTALISITLTINSFLVVESSTLGRTFGLLPANVSTSTPTSKHLRLLLLVFM